MKIEMVSVMVNDPVKAFQYYTEVLGFKEHLYMPENHLAIVKSGDEDAGETTILLEPVHLGGIDIAIKFKNEMYNLGYPIITLSATDVQETVKDLKDKGVTFKKDLTKTDFGYEAIFDDDNGNYIQLIQMGV